jgi:hypothetical protein
MVYSDCDVRLMASRNVRVANNGNASKRCLTIDKCEAIIAALMLAVSWKNFAEG